MDLNNLQIGQKLYSAINGEVIFDGYIENPQGEKYLICCRKDKLLQYYFLDGKFSQEGIIVLFCHHIESAAKYCMEYEGVYGDVDVTKPTIILTNPVKQIAEIVKIYNEILNSDYVTEEMLSDNNLMAEEIWQRMQ